MIHSLKQHPQHFEKVLAGEKTFEVRENDRGYVVGDLLALNEWDPEKKEYTGRSCLVYVDYLWSGPEYVREGYVIMSIKPCSVLLGFKMEPEEYEVPLAPIGKMAEKGLTADG